MIFRLRPRSSSYYLRLITWGPLIYLSIFAVLLLGQASQMTRHAMLNQVLLMAAFTGFEMSYNTLQYFRAVRREKSRDKRLQSHR